MACYEQKIENELWDIYDINRNLTGRTHRRGVSMAPGDYHLVVHVCIFNSKNELLIQRRQPWKKGWPNMWDVSVGGSAIAGDDSQKAAMRETKEEIGLDIDLTGVRPHLTINFEHGFDDYYLLTMDIDIRKLKLQKEEVREVKWVNKEELLRMVDSGEMIPHSLLDKLFEIKNHYGVCPHNNQVEITYATMEHLASWMSLLDIVRWNAESNEFDYFPGLETEELVEGYRNTVIKNINRKSAICAVVGKQVVGILLFSIKYNMLCCMAVHPEYRKNKIASRMISEMLKNLDRSRVIVVETFRENDPRGKSPRALYESLGFEAGELIEWIAENGTSYPEQRYILKPSIEVE